MFLSLQLELGNECKVSASSKTSDTDVQHA